MPKVLAISSSVARGHIGLSAIVPVLHRRGYETIALPTVVLSNHPGHPHFAGSAVTPSHLQAMLDAITQSGWLQEVDAVLTGYCPTAAHVQFVADAITRVQDANPAVRVLCDPVLGDDPDGLYVGEDVARAVQELLLPRAWCITPNRFELEWLTGQPLGSVFQAVDAARALAVREVVATSIPADAGQLATLSVTAEAAHAVVGPELIGVPHGTGDMLAAMYLSGRLGGCAPSESLAIAVSGVGAAIGASLGADELQLVASQGLWVAPSPAELLTL